MSTPLVLTTVAGSLLGAVVAAVVAAVPAAPKRRSVPVRVRRRPTSR